MEFYSCLFVKFVLYTGRVSWGGDPANAFVCRGKALEPESEAGGGVREAVGIAAFQDDAQGVAYVEAEATEATITEDETGLVGIKTFDGDAGETARMQFHHLAQIEAVHQAGGQGKIDPIGIQHASVTEIGAQLEATVQMLRHRDIAGNKAAITGETSCLDGDEFGTRGIRFLTGKGISSRKKGNRKGCKECDRTFHRFKVFYTHYKYTKKS
jgi:hypothetical protein